MKHMTEKTYTREVIDFVTCDFCKQKIGYKMFEVDDITIERHVGSCFPEGGSGEKISVDACGKCWDGLLMPAIRGLGVEPNRTEWDI